MKKSFASFAAVLAIACIAVGLRAANVEPDTDLSNVKVTVYQGTTPLISMSGADCVSVFYVLPSDVKARIADEWNKFSDVARTQGTYAGVRYSFRNDWTFESNGYKVVVTNVTAEMVRRVLDLSE